MKQQEQKAKDESAGKEKEVVQEKPYRPAYSETFVEPVGMGPIKDK